MKRALAFLLALVLCAACIPAMAETAQTYTHPTHGYSFEVPASWLCVDKTNVQDYINAMMTGEMAFTGIDGMTLTQLKPQLELADMVFFICSANNNVTFRKVDFGMELTMEQFTANLLPQLNQATLNAIPGAVLNDAGSQITLGDKTFVTTVTYYEILGTSVAADALYYVEGTAMYELIITSRDTGNAAERTAFYEGAMQMVLSLNTGAKKTPTGLGEYVSFADTYKAPAGVEETAPAAAEETQAADAYQTYTHTDGYSMIVPQAWIAVDRANAQSRIDAAAAGQIAFAGVNAQQLMKNIKVQVDAQNSVIFVDEKGNYVACAAQNMGQAITYDQYEEYVLPMVKNTYSAKAGYREIIGGQRVMYGGREFILMEVEFGSGTTKSHILQLIYLDGTYIYSIAANVLPLYDQAVIDAFNGDVIEAAATFVPIK